MTTNKDVRRMLLSLSDDNLASVLDLWANSVRRVADPDAGDGTLCRIVYLVSAVGNDKLYYSMRDFRIFEPESDFKWVGPIADVQRVLIEEMSLVPHSINKPRKAEIF